jgi:hypothetical protein
MSPSSYIRDPHRYFPQTRFTSLLYTWHSCTPFGISPHLFNQAFHYYFENKEDKWHSNFSFPFRYFPSMSPSSYIRDPHRYFPQTRFTSLLYTWHSCTPFGISPHLFNQDFHYYFENKEDKWHSNFSFA